MSSESHMWVHRHSILKEDSKHQDQIEEIYRAHILYKYKPHQSQFSPLSFLQLIIEFLNDDCVRAIR